MSISIEENCLETLVWILEVGVVSPIYPAVQLPKHRIPKTPNEVSILHIQNDSLQLRFQPCRKLSTLCRATLPKCYSKYSLSVLSVVYLVSSTALHVNGREIHGCECVGRPSKASHLASVLDLCKPSSRNINVYRSS